MSAMSRTTRRSVLLVQLPIPPLGPAPVRGNVPLAAACLKLFAEREGLGQFYAIEIFPGRQANVLGDRALVEALAARAPWLVRFTCYLWNIERTLWVTRELKRRRPAPATGGPRPPDGPTPRPPRRSAGRRPRTGRGGRRRGGAGRSGRLFGQRLSCRRKRPSPDRDGGPTRPRLAHPRLQAASVRRVRSGFSRRKPSRSPFAGRAAGRRSACSRRTGNGSGGVARAATPPEPSSARGGQAGRRWRQARSARASVTPSGRPC
jgi:hypothetical protein